jgi:DoxX-like protein
MTKALLTPLWLIHSAVAAVWFYEGVWCKLLNRQPRQMRVVEAMPLYGTRIATKLLRLVGVVETTIAVWVLTGIGPILCALTQTALLVTLNVCGLLWARRLIDDPGGMVVKNFAFLVLVWVSASFPTWR